MCCLFKRSKGATSSSGDVQCPPKPYFFRASSVSERNQWIDHINLAIAEFQEERRRQQQIQQNFYLRNQMWLRQTYNSIEFRMATALCVGLNFVAMVRHIPPFPSPPPPPAGILPHLRSPRQMCQAQLLGQGSGDGGGSVSMIAAFDTLELIFTAIFSCEMLMNMAAYWLRPFLADPWSWFDMVRRERREAISVPGADGSAAPQQL
jgi:hypothetical protein